MAKTLIEPTEMLAEIENIQTTQSLLRRLIKVNLDIREVLVNISDSLVALVDNTVDKAVFDVKINNRNLVVTIVKRK